MRHAKAGDTVHVHYTGSLGDGTQFDSSRDRDPMSFTLGEGRVIPGFDAAVTGMAVGESKTVTLAAGDAYGPRRDEMLVTVPRTQVPPHVTLEAGQRMQIGRGEQALPVVVREVTDDHVVLDGNHPLAGEDLTFALELVGID